MLSGFQQVSCMPQRDLLECSLLLQKFALDRPAIQRWKKDSDADEFRAGKIRECLEKTAAELPEGFIKDIRLVYAGLSKRGIHPHYAGIARMLMKEAQPLGNLFWGPFFDLEKLRISLSAFTLDIFFAAYSVVSTFGGIESLDPILRTRYESLLASNLLWLQKYGAKGEESTR